MKKTTLLISFFMMMGIATTSCGENPRLFAGGFTKGDEKGLNIYEFDNRTGKLKLLSQSDAGPNPSYFCFSSRNDLLYAANEVMQFKGNQGGGLTTLKYDPVKASFEKLNEMVVPNGGPCFISMSPDSGYLFIANYPRGSVAVIRLDKNGIPESVTDTIIYNPEKPNQSHAHMILSDPQGKHIYVSDLGLNRVVIYNFDKVNGKLIQLENGIITVPEGSGPRHFTFSHDGSEMYLINELGSTMMTFKNDPQTGLKLIQTLSTRGLKEVEKNYCADIHFGKNGEYLYGSNRGENSIVVYKTGSNGMLSLAGHSSCGGDWPRNFVIDPTGNFLLAGNQRSDNIAVFRINSKTGIPEGPVDSTMMKGPACLKFY
ncbi:MAG TPA: lactonase family protein [Bacteroidales bacterium]|nr:lactonase family protein [Bacteroidales bacterium]HOX73561.1 lactonase family protein [Bacteroidales bacterium]HQM68055.1 lactonase family protein [Bacteroidales bacterium]